MMLSSTCSSSSFVFCWCSALLLVFTTLPSCQAWVVVNPTAPPRRPLSFSFSTVKSSLASSTTATTGSIRTPADNESDETATDGDVEYEYVEYDTLSEQDFAGSEWLVGTNWDSSLDKIDETWVRLAVDKTTGNNIAIWGDNSQGKWSLDVASQFFSFSKESKFAGKQIWAGVVDDYYFLQGTVRGWTFWQAASVLAQWQAKRLGVDPQEAGTPPWFADPDDQENSNNDDDESSSQ